MERELRKMSTLGTALAQALNDRGIPEPTATLAAQSGVTVFRASFAEWIADGSEHEFAEIARHMFAELGALTAPTR
jgi:hypothetical protein